MRLRVLLITLLMLLPAMAERPPNIVLIVSDDHHWADYGFMGRAVVQTPHLDRLAAQSLTFRRGYVTSSLCGPSLASLITGKYPHQHKVTGNDPARPAGMTAAAFYNTPAYAAGRDVMSRHLQKAGTLPARLKARGYLSLQTGKWWQNSYTSGGFTHGMTQGGRHGDAGLEIGRTTMQPIYDFIADAQKKEAPFFIWYAPMMPHTPHTPPERLLAKYRGETPSLHVAKYYAMIEWFDETCGQLLAHLESKRLRENTIVVYLADNGWITDPDTGRYAARSKQSQYEGGLRTPIMLNWPAKVTPLFSEHPASAIDIAPTLLAAAGVTADSELPGLNLLDPAALKARRSISGECFTHDISDLHDPAASLRWRWRIEDSWKLIVPSPKNEPAAPMELYRLDKDPAELTNLAEKDPARVERMRSELDAWWSGT